jgi:hypothetical protein
VADPPADTTAPTVQAPVSRLYALATLGSSTSPVRTYWSATDPCGVSAYTLERKVNGGSWYVQSLPTTTTTRVYRSLSFGATYRYVTKATDGAGNTSGWVYGASFEPLLSQQTSGAVTYGGTWHAASNTYASGGSLEYTTASGASATFTFTGYGVSWVAYRGPNRGSAAIYLDGIYRATVKLYSASYHARQIVYAANWGANGTHTLKIVNLATSGHPRIDVDAFVRLYRSRTIEDDPQRLKRPLSNGRPPLPSPANDAPSKSRCADAYLPRGSDGSWRIRRRDGVVPKRKSEEPRQDDERPRQKPTAWLELVMQRDREAKSRGDEVDPDDHLARVDIEVFGEPDDQRVSGENGAEEPADERSDRVRRHAVDGKQESGDEDQRYPEDPVDGGAKDEEQPRRLVPPSESLRRRKRSRSDRVKDGRRTGNCQTALADYSSSRSAPISMGRAIHLRSSSGTPGTGSLQGSMRAST